MVGPVFRIRSIIERKGESFTVGASNRKGIFAIASHAQARIYASEANLSGANTPIYAIMVRDDDSTLITDTIIWAGHTLGIHAISSRTLFGSNLFKIIIAS